MTFPAKIIVDPACEERRETFLTEELLMGGRSLENPWVFRQLTHLEFFQENHRALCGRVADFLV